MAKASKGFKGIKCICCGEVDNVNVKLEDMEFTCTSCNTDFTADEVREFMEDWKKVLAWVESVPSR